MVTALYRRYRPEAFAEMIGQSQVTDPLMTALRTGRVGHAYLFSGPRGCGKTTSARILARCLNCAEGPTDTPCGVCPSCLELSRGGGGSLDVVEIDAASHGGVDDARDLRERAVFAPARDRFKIFIIDEAHMVTPGGFNALLKIVEEPPPHVKFIFATTEPDKVIGTIRSRTHHYPFRLIAPATLIDYVQSLCDSEGVQVEPGVLPLVVRAGGGSVRDTLSILDQLIAGSEAGVVTAERAAGLLGFTHTELIDDVVSALGAGDAAAAFTATDRVVQTGQDPRRFVEDLLERLRDLIVVGATSVQGAAAVFRGVPEDQLQRMFEQARGFGAGQLSRIADTVSDALDKMAGATAPRLQLELMIARALVGAASPAPPLGQGQGAGVAGQQRTPSGAPAQQAGQRPAPPAQAAQPVPQAQAAQPVPQAQPAGQAPGHPQSQPETPASRPDPQPATQSAEPQAAAGQTAEGQPAQAPAATPAQQAPAAVNAAEAARAAREFLRTDSAGTAPFGRPVTDVLGMIDERAAQAQPSAPVPPPAEARPPAQAGSAAGPPAPASGSSETGSGQPSPDRDGRPVAASAGGQASEAQQPPSAPPESGQSAEAGVDVQLTLDELRDMWPDLLEEILESDREAWNAVRVVTPLAIEGAMLQVGLVSASDLEAFKKRGAVPLRETILAATGVQVKYLPRQIPAGSPEQPTAAPQPDAEEPDPGQAFRSEQRTRPAASQQAGSPSQQSDSPSQQAGSPSQQTGSPSQQSDSPSQQAPSQQAGSPHAASQSGREPSGAAAQPPTPQAPPEAPAVRSQPPASPQAVRPETRATPQAAGPRVSAAAPARGADPDERDTVPAPAWLDYAPEADGDRDVSDDPDDDPYAGADGDPYLAGAGASSGGATPRAPETDAGRAQAESERGAIPAPAAEAMTVPLAGSADAAAPAQPAGAAPPAGSADAAAPAIPAADPDPQPDPKREKKSGGAPAFTRYGEAVVREVLGARFIEERPLPSAREY